MRAFSLRKFGFPTLSSRFLRVQKSLAPKVLLTWVRVWRTAPVLSWIQAAQQFRAEQFQQAAKLYKLGLLKHPTHKAAECAWLDYSYCMLRIGDIREARDILASLVSAGSGLREVYALLARIEHCLGNPVKAKAVLESFLGEHPEDYDFRTRLCYLSLSSAANDSELDEVMQEAEIVRAKLSYEQKDTALIDTCFALFEHRYGDRALGSRILSRVLAAGGAPYEAFLLRAEQYLENGRTVAARELLGRAIHLRAYCPRALALLAHSYLNDPELERPEWAVSLAEESARLSGWQNPDTLQILRECYNELGDTLASELLSARMAEALLAQSAPLELVYTAEQSVRQLQAL